MCSVMVGFTSTTTSTVLVGDISLAYSVECWILNLEAPGFISRFRVKILKGEECNGWGLAVLLLALC